MQYFGNTLIKERANPYAAVMFGFLSPMQQYVFFAITSSIPSRCRRLDIRHTRLAVALEHIGTVCDIES